MDGIACSELTFGREDSNMSNNDNTYALTMARVFMRRGERSQNEALMMALNRMAIESPIHRQWDELMRELRTSSKIAKSGPAMFATRYFAKACQHFTATRKPRQSRLESRRRTARQQKGALSATGTNSPRIRAVTKTKTLFKRA